jgi:agmatine deiminase
MAANYGRLAGQTDAKGRPLRRVALNAPGNYGTSNGVTLNDTQMTNFAAGYINFYQCNGALIVPKFNDPSADGAAVAVIRPYAGSRAIVQVDILGIASGGGACIARRVNSPLRCASGTADPIGAAVISRSTATYTHV